MKLLYLFCCCFAIIAVEAQTVGLIEHQTGTLDDGYVLFAPNTSNTTYLIDKCGKAVQSWNSTYKPGQAVYLLDDGTLMRTGNANNTTFNAGGKGGVIEKMDWNGNVIWSYTISDATKCQHHDAKIMPNGNVLVIAWEKKTNTEAIALGRNPSLVPAVLWSEQILEIQPTGATTGTVVWEWHLTDHLVQDYDATKPNYNTIATNPQLVNINYNASATNSDWIHLNSIDYNPQLDQILVSNHNFDEIWIIDHSTTTNEAASHTGGNSGKGGDLLYRWGNPMAYNTGTTAHFFGQHNARWIENGLPFENQIMVFNNGLGRTGGNYSTVDIINPPVVGYQYDAALPYLPASTSWTYNSGNLNNFYAMNISGAQPLSNGNILICNGPAGIFTEIDNSGTTLWKYVNPVNASGVIAQNATPTQNSVFRCTFYPIDFIGFAGHTLSSGTIIESSNVVSSSCNLTLSNDTFLSDEIKVFPNPATDFIQIQSPRNANNLKVDFLDILGKVISCEVVVMDDNTITINTSRITKGFYFIRITDCDRMKTFKVKIN